MSTAPHDQKDLADMARLMDGEDAALSDLMTRHSQRLFHYLFRLLQNETESADVAQETFVRVYLNRRRFRSRQKFTTWLYTIGTNLARDRLRWRVRHPQLSLEATGPNADSALEDVIPDGSPAPPDVLEAQERVAAVRQAVAQLPEELRVPLVLAEYEERSQADIAALLGCSAKAVEMRIYRARQQLRQSLGKWLKNS